MIREFAFGFSNRHYFQDSNNAVKWEHVAKDTFVSLYAYDTDVELYFEENKTLAGFDGLIYIPSEFLLDVDGTNIEDAQKKTLSLISLLEKKKVPVNIYFSGRGFHVGIPDKAFRWKPCSDLHLKVKDELKSHGIFEYADVSVTDKTRIIRLNNTLNSRSNLWKIKLHKAELMTMSSIEIEALAAKPRQAEIKKEFNCEPVFDVMVRETKKSTVKYQAEVGMNPDPVNYPCIQNMLEGVSYGSRHATALRIGAWMRWLYPEHVVRLVMEDWRQRVDNPDNPLPKPEIDKIVTDCYKGHNGSGYRYGCMDLVMDKHCKSSCRLYKSKKSQSLMDATQMESDYINFIMSDVSPLNIGELYGEDLPIYPGELVVLQAPPKSMKTMLMQNWVNAFKKPTYFLELEMSPRQIWTRFIMIEKGWTEEDIRQHYLETNNGISNLFQWLHVDYAPCYAMELEKRIAMLPIKPEIVVVDHMGLMMSKHKDLNMKMEEIAGALTEIAIKHNLIVFTVSEITKQAMVEGMNISSSRGSFRIAYNASKVLALKANKSPQGDIESLNLTTIANREKGNLNKKLILDNVTIKPAPDHQIIGDF